MKKENREEVWLFGVEYITWGMDRPNVKYFMKKANAQKFYEEITSNPDFRADRPRRMALSFNFAWHISPFVMISDCSKELHDFIISKTFYSF